MTNRLKKISAILMAFSITMTMLPISNADAVESRDYTFIEDYTLGWNNGIVAYKDGIRTSLSAAGVPIYNKSSDNPFGPEVEQAWDEPNLKLTMPVKFTTNDGIAHPVESMLTNWNFVADPTAIDNSDVDGKLYVYGTTEGFEYNSSGTMSGNGYNNHSLTIMSTTDMVNWTDEGVLDSQNLTNEPSTSGNKVKVKWSQRAWAPSGLKHDGDGDGEDEFYIFYTDGGTVCYLMGDSPVGPWYDVNKGQQMFTSNSPGCYGVVWCFDPAVIRDDKGNVYIYFGGGTNSDQKNGKTGRVCKLKFIEGTGQAVPDGTPQPLETYYFFEDSEINQFNGKYYYSYCTNWGMPENDKWVGGGVIAAYVSTDPMNIAFQPDKANGDQYEDRYGTYHHFLGEILDNPSVIYGQAYNNHHHMQSFKGKNYIFYHSTVLNNTIHRVSNQYRNLHVDEIEVDEETEEISITPTYEGADQIGSFDPYKNFDGSEKYINATTTSYSAGVMSTRDDDMVLNSKNGSPMVLDRIDTGDWTKLQGVDFGGQVTSVEATYTSPTDDAAIEVFIDDPTSADNKVATLNLKTTNGYNTVKTDITDSVGGVHDVYFVFRGSGYKVADWKFEGKEAAEGTAPPIVKPTETPTAAPTAKPTVKPTAAPTVKPTVKPTIPPTAKPTAKPTVKPTETPTITPATQTPSITTPVSPTATPNNSFNNGQNTVLENTQIIAADFVSVVKSKKVFNINAKSIGNSNLIYASSNTKVLTVNEYGKVTIKGYGKATITITSPATTQYKLTSKKMTITVLPKKMKVKVLISKGKITWKKDASVTGYQIYLSEKKNFNGKAIRYTCNKKQTSLSTSFLKINKKYYVKARAYKKIGKKKYYGKWSKVKNIMFK